MLAGPEFPLWDGRSEDPAPGRDFAGWLATLRRHLDTLGLERVVVVHSILYGADNAVTLAALRALGPAARGIALVRDGAGEAELDALAEAGVRGVRLNYVHGGVLSWEGARALAPALAARGMHIQMLLHADRHLAELAGDIRALPVPLVIDHLGWPAGHLEARGPGIDTLAALLSEGHVHVKLSGAYRLTGAPFEAADALTARLAAANPERCLWGSDWPHIMLNGAERPDAGVLLDAFARAVPGAAARRAILVDTPAALYGF